MIRSYLPRGNLLHESGSGALHVCPGHGVPLAKKECPRWEIYTCRSWVWDCWFIMFYSKFQIDDATWTWTHCYDWLCIYIYIYITHMYMTVYVWCVSLNHVSVFVIFLSYILGRAYLEYLHSLCSKHTEKELHIWHYDSDFIGGSGWLIFEKMGGLAILVVWQLGWLNLIQVSGSTTTAFNIQKYLENQRFPDRTMIYH